MKIFCAEFFIFFFYFYLHEEFWRNTRNREYWFGNRNGKLRDHWIWVLQKWAKKVFEIVYTYTYLSNWVLGMDRPALAMPKLADPTFLAFLWCQTVCKHLCQDHPFQNTDLGFKSASILPYYMVLKQCYGKHRKNFRGN